VSRSLRTLILALHEYAGAGGVGIGSYSFPGPEVGRAGIFRAHSLDKESETKAGEHKREKQLRLKRRQKVKFRVGNGSSKNWARHPDDVE
jgi:hypothetical protein